MAPATVLAVIPARYGSTRLVGKPLMLLGGVPIIVRTMQSVRRARRVDEVVVATDDVRIRDTVRDAGGEAILSKTECANGSMRVRDAVEQLSDAFRTVVNVQGDEPLIDPAHVDELISVFDDDDDDDDDDDEGGNKQNPVHVGTLAAPITDSRDLTDPNTVKCVLKHNGDALYFSRAPIPYAVDPKGVAEVESCAYLRHIGAYAFRRSFLVRSLPTMCPSPLQRIEALEQLQWLQNGFRIRVKTVKTAAERGVDTADDLVHLEQALRRLRPL